MCHCSTDYHGVTVGAQHDVAGLSLLQAAHQLVSLGGPAATHQNTAHRSSLRIRAPACSSACGEMLHVCLQGLPCSRTMHSPLA